MVEAYPVKNFRDGYRSLFFRTIGEPLAINTDKLREEFIAADDSEKMGTFLIENLITDGMEIEDALSMREVFVSVLNVVSLIDDKVVTLDALAECGLAYRPELDAFYFSVPVVHDGYYRRYIQSLSENEPFATKRGISVLVTYSFDSEADNIKACLPVSVLNDGYGAPYWGERGELISHRFEFGDNPDLSDERVLERIARLFVSSAITAHLRHVRIVSSLEFSEVIACNEFISTLWYSLFDAFRVGRVGRCEQCHKPYIARKERGRKRRWCSPLCSKRNQRKPKPTDTTE
ncbi:MAG: hypothetical protein LBI64_03050 [Coriobacteriales bacterium]|nr:hypothetical protein [Coriobacteriales bacterium]